MKPYDAIIIGGGPAGLSAGLILGRCRRRVLICDAGNQRNRWSHGMHGYLTRDGIAPADFLKQAQAEVKHYGVELRHCSVDSASKADNLFHVQLHEGPLLSARKLLVATGVTDHLPPVSNIEEFYGKSVHHCPYCDGWEHRDQPIAVFSKTAGLAFALRTWSEDLTLFTHGAVRIPVKDRERLRRFNIPVHRVPIRRLEGANGQLTGVTLEDGATIPCKAMFFSTGQHQTCGIGENLGCLLNRRGTFDTNKLEMSNVAGVYVAGDASKDVQLVIVAAAEGAKAAFAINCALQEEDGITPPAAERE